LYTNENDFTPNRIIWEALEDIAPAGFKGVRKDYHYIIQLIIADSAPMSFNPVQQKQWFSYYSEISELLRFTLLRKKEELNWSILEIPTQYNNVAFSAINSNKPLYARSLVIRDPLHKQFEPSSTSRK
jgi:hypothetical protein